MCAQANVQHVDALQPALSAVALPPAAAASSASLHPDPSLQPGSATSAAAAAAAGGLGATPGGAHAKPLGLQRHYHMAVEWVRAMREATKGVLRGVRLPALLASGQGGCQAARPAEQLSGALVIRRGGRGQRHLHPVWVFAMFHTSLPLGPSRRAVAVAGGRHCGF